MDTNQIKGIILNDGTIHRALVANTGNITPSKFREARIPLPGGYRLIVEPYGLAFISKPLEQISVAATFIERDGLLFIGDSDGDGDYDVRYRAHWATGNKDQILFGYMNGACYLVIEEHESGQLYCPPLPNVYASGALCMPEVEDYEGDLEIAGLSQVEALEKYYKLFDASEWNTDLEPSRVARWDMDFNPVPIDDYYSVRFRRYLKDHQS